MVVAALTRQRPEMLRELLLSWARMTLPEQCSVKCLIVENDVQQVSRSVIDGCRPHFIDRELLYVLEPELGIPFGRNRAAKVAIAQNADLLLFVDDDEEVAEDWLVRMISGYRYSDAVLLGAPLRAKLPAEQLSFFQSKMFANIEARYRQKELRARNLATLNTTRNVTIVTNNWLAETAIFRDHGIWFDENMRFTGGTDAKFYLEVCKAGLPTGWVADAFVYETVPPKRLSFWYQYRRARDQSNTHIRRKSETSRHTIGAAVLGALAKIIPFIYLSIAIPFTGGRTVLGAARTLGWISGRLGYVFGARSVLYLEVTGN
ncbi:hypothetical protein [Ferirhizobium litorale]|uniref:Glycosyltransferase 2-like domain-containing protein n=1 Tax=Ferirhizobium litorale TaxID=2927786 RepID=A0AAE3QFF4_9HYPH|nr:hypothetical protein [Fererhizobium litorale]MDI7924046.1 hypothetical protein [Fererhizobium litorale]